MDPLQAKVPQCPVVSQSFWGKTKATCSGASGITAASFSQPGVFRCFASPSIIMTPELVIDCSAVEPWWCGWYLECNASSAPPQHRVSASSAPNSDIAPDQRINSAVCRNKLTLKVRSGRCKMGCFCWRYTSNCQASIVRRRIHFP